jgi:predicted LPLAT superfamily acyltransferase
MTARPLWLLQRERGSRVLIQAIARVALAWGRPVGRALLYPICAYFLLFSGATRRASAAYLARVLGRAATWRERFHHYHCFASTILDRVFLLTGRVDALTWDVKGLEILQEKLADRRGCLLFGAHFGSFDILRVLALAESPVRVRVLMHASNAEKLAGVLHALNAELPSQVIALGRPTTMLEVRDALAAGEIVGLLADRAVQGDRVVACDFLGTAAGIPAGPFELAALLQVPVVAFTGVYAGKAKYQVSFEAFADRIELPAGRRADALQEHCQRFAAWLEQRCRAAPYNWFNFYDFWATARKR